jgi:hypothetical protein
LPHQQQLFLYEKLFGKKQGLGQKSTFQVFIGYLKSLFQSSSLSLYKKPIIAAWSLVVMLLPKLLAEPLVAMGYQYGLVLATKKTS